MRKKIIDWLFGADYPTYKELFNTYEGLYDEYILLSVDYLKLIDKASNLIQEMTSLIDINVKLLKICKKNNIDINVLKDIELELKSELENNN